VKFYFRAKRFYLLTIVRSFLSDFLVSFRKNRRINAFCDRQDLSSCAVTWRKCRPVACRDFRRGTMTGTTMRVPRTFSQCYTWTVAWINIDHSCANGNIIFIYGGHSVARRDVQLADDNAVRNPITLVLCVRPGEERSPSDFSRRMQRPSLLHRHSQPASFAVCTTLESPSRNRGEKCLKNSFEITLSIIKLSVIFKIRNVEFK